MPIDAQYMTLRHLGLGTDHTGEIPASRSLMNGCFRTVLHIITKVSVHLHCWSPAIKGFVAAHAEITDARRTRALSHTRPFVYRFPVQTGMFSNQDYKRWGSWNESQTDPMI